ncbi:MAG: DUF1499 domain-containing protein [Pseudomonadota bacterium]
MSRARVVLSPSTLTVIGEQPMSRSAVWGRNLGGFAVLFAIIAFAFHAFGAAETPSFLMAMKISLVLATIAILLSIRAFGIIWRRGKRGLSSAILGIFYGILLWLVPAGVFAMAIQYPKTTDVITQGHEPLSFLKIEGVRPAWANPVTLDKVMPSPLSRALLTDATSDEVYGIITDMVLDRDWDIVADRPPDEKKPREASLQATETSFAGFTDDIVIEISIEDKQTRVDMRSASRIGTFDLGQNAARIDAFMVNLRQKLNER